MNLDEGVWGGDLCALMERGIFGRGRWGSCVASAAWHCDGRSGLGRRYRGYLGGCASYKPQRRIRNVNVLYIWVEITVCFFLLFCVRADANEFLSGKCVMGGLVFPSLYHIRLL